MRIRVKKSPNEAASSTGTKLYRQLETTMSMTEEQRARMERMKKVAQEKKKWKERAALNEGKVGSEAPAVSAGSVGAKLANPTSSFYNSQAAPPPPLPRGNFRPQEQTSAFQHQVKVCSLDLCQ